MGCGPELGFGKFLNLSIVSLFLKTFPGDFATIFAALSKSFAKNA